MQTTDQAASTETKPFGNRLIAPSLLAIDLVLLQSLISTGVVDFATLISTIALSASIPLLTLSFVIEDLVNSSKQRKELSQKEMEAYLIAQIAGASITILGIIALLWHVSWIAACIFTMTGFYSCTVFSNMLARKYRENSTRM